MTPAALTPAARSAQTGTTSRRAAGHTAAPPRKPRQAPAPRRVSGPVAGAGRASAPARPGTRPARSRPARPVRRGARPTAGAPLALGARVAAFVRTLPDHAWLDRIVRGRAWIPILGVLLAGIVAMQVEVLKLSASTGRVLERGTALQSRNEQLRASVAVLSDDQRIERLAAGMGMVMPGPTTIKFLGQPGGIDVIRALNGIHPPNGAVFTASLPAVTGLGAAASTGASPSGAGPAAQTGVASGSTASTATAVSGSPAATGSGPATGTAQGTPSSQAQPAPPPTGTAAPSAGTAAPAGTTPAASPTTPTGGAGVPTGG